MGGVYLVCDRLMFKMNVIFKVVCVVSMNINKAYLCISSGSWLFLFQSCFMFPFESFCGYRYVTQRFRKISHQKQDDHLFGHLGINN